MQWNHNDAAAAHLRQDVGYVVHPVLWVRVLGDLLHLKLLIYLSLYHSWRVSVCKCECVGVTGINTEMLHISHSWPNKHTPLVACVKALHSLSCATQTDWQIPEISQIPAGIPQTNRLEIFRFKTTTMSSVFSISGYINACICMCICIGSGIPGPLLRQATYCT